MRRRRRIELRCRQPDERRRDAAADAAAEPYAAAADTQPAADGNLAGLADAGFMDAYWDATELLFQRLAMFGRPAVVHVEPDFWGYAQQMSGGDPSSVEVRVNTAP
ncbi:MAG: hypothetical protein IT379_10940, partial [Deltaproteobacteria bacterium]|nr:hypothetical protein [Deltaproteobacteria bacterium]